MKKYTFMEYLHKKRQNMVKPHLLGSVLDIGCGPATTYSDFNLRDYTGIERDQEHVNKLKNKFSLAQFHVRDIEKEKLNLNKTFDTIVLIAVIEHIKDTDLLYKEIKNHLKENGRLVMTTPTPLGNFIHTLLSFVGITSKLAASEHVNICTHKKFKEIAKKYNLKLIKYSNFEFFCNSLVVFEKKEE